MAVTAVVVLLVDQLSKAIVVREIDPGTSVPVIDGVLRLVHTSNTGIAGGRLADADVGVIVAIAAAGLGGLMLVARSLGPRRGLWLPVGLVLGGGLGNLLDRFRSGAVTDFLVFGDSGPANLADQAILLGVVGMLIVGWWPERRPAVADA